MALVYASILVANISPFLIALLKLGIACLIKLIVSPYTNKEPSSASLVSNLLTKSVLRVVSKGISALFSDCLYILVRVNLFSTLNTFEVVSELTGRN